MKTTIDRQTGRRFRWQYVGGFKHPDWPEHLMTVYRNGRRHGQKSGPRGLVFLNPVRLTPAMFAKLNPGKVQPVCIRPQDDPDLRSTARPAQVNP